jgi:AGCS family alanine or glycine:cation symporter
MFEPLSRAIYWTSDAVWGPWRTSTGEIPGPLVVLLMGVGIFLTLRLRFVQVVQFPRAVRSILPRPSTGTRGVLTPFQTFATALAATIGTGNIAGVATAVVSGGPGAVFWIWCYGFFATATKFTEAVLGISFRVTGQAGGESLSSGPPYYLRDGMRLGWLAWTYALVAGVAALTTTPFTQPNSIAVVANSQLGVPTWMTGVAVAVLTWLVIIGGIQAIGRTMEKLAPVKVLLYLAGGLIVIVSHAGNIPSVLSTIVHDAFSFKAAAGASAGVGIMVAMRYGLARGVYANEAGYGTAAVAYGTAQSARPEQQGLNAVMEVFIISFVTSSISALTILVSGVAQESMTALRAGGEGLTSTALVAQAFNSAVPTVGGWVVAFCAFLFGYTTLIGWAFYGEQFFEYLTAGRLSDEGRSRFTMAYRWIYCLLIPLGAIAKVDVVWAWGDLMNGLQIFPNVIGLLGLSGLAASFARRRQ